MEVVYADAGIQCSRGLFSLDEILATGVVGDNHCDRKLDPEKLTSVQGEVLFFVGKYHWWQGGQD
jgi:hypothetical protein